MEKPCLYLIPTPLGKASLPCPDIAAVVATLTDYVAETAKQARAFLKAYDLPVPIQSIAIAELNEHSKPDQIKTLLAPLHEGRSMGLISDAGCPGIADPGAPLVLLAHRAGFRVKPLVGPCSITLALMASGLDGQQHHFLGYLPANKKELVTALRSIEQTSRAQKATMIFIETPYRNDALLDAIVATCRPDTRLCIAANLTQPDERITTMTLVEWKKSPIKHPKQPCVFLLRV